jgi:hypothetical protein
MNYCTELFPLKIDSVDPAIQVLQEILINASKQGVSDYIPLYMFSCAYSSHE